VAGVAADDVTPFGVGKHCLENGVRPLAGGLGEAVVRPAAERLGLPRVRLTPDL
jgi:hypothetical protein